MKKFFFSSLVGLTLITFTGCTESNKGATEETKKCQTDKCGEVKCGNAKKVDTKKAETPAK